MIKKGKCKDLQLKWNKHKSGKRERLKTHYSNHSIYHFSEVLVKVTPIKKLNSNKKNKHSLKHKNNNLTTYSATF